MSNRKQVEKQSIGDSCIKATRPRLKRRFNSTHYPLSTTHNSPRRGFTLVEMVCAITVSALLLGIAVVLLASLMRSEHSGREHFERGNSLDALAARFRKDIHAAIYLPDEIGGSDNSCDITMETSGITRIVTYTIDGEYFTRHEQPFMSDDALRRQKTETYALPKNCSVSVKNETIDGEPVAVLLIEANDASPDPGRNIRVEARLGSDHRFDADAENEKDNDAEK